MILRVLATAVSGMLDGTEIEAVYANGKKAEHLYKKYVEPVTGREIISLPSTSPANAAFTMERLKDSWKQILSV